MNNIKKTANPSSGFIAFISVFLIALGTIGFWAAVQGAVTQYEDYVNKRESRIQAGLNMEGCIITLKLLSNKNVFIHGDVHISELGCFATISNNYPGMITADVRTEFNGVSVYEHAIIRD